MSSGTPSRMATITEHKAAQVEHADASGRTRVIFVHGLWLLPSSWDLWTNRLQTSPPFTRQVPVVGVLPGGRRPAPATRGPNRWISNRQIFARERKRRSYGACDR